MNTLAPNHHAHYPGFSGISGLVAALSMLGGRSGQAALAIELSGTAAGDTVVDVGCGPGAAARMAAKLGATVIGVDPAPVMLSVARLVTNRLVMGRSAAVRYVSGSAESLDLDDGSATVAWSIATVHHWTDVAAGLREVRRVLRPAGRFVAIERLSQDGARGLASHGWTERQALLFADECTACGFVEVTVGRHPAIERSPISVTARRPQQERGKP